LKTIYFVHNFIIYGDLFLWKIDGLYLYILNTCSGRVSFTFYMIKIGYFLKIYKK